MIYLDHAATTPLSDAAWQAMAPVLKDVYGNPSSMHRLGRDARNHLTRARERMAGLFNASTRDLYFTSGATEANNWALRAGAGLAAQKGCRHILTTAIEHPSVLAVCESLEAEGFEITYLKPDANGLILPEQVEAALQADTGLVSIQWVNNEIGSMQDIEAIGALVRARGILFHTDAVQAVAHQRIDWPSFPADFLTFSGHKVGGPKGVGALLTRSVRGTAIELEPLIVGGRQERGRRAGTENLSGIVGMAAALDDTLERMTETGERQGRCAKRLIAALEEASLDFTLHGPSLDESNRRVPGILNLYFSNTDGQTMILLLDRAGVAVSLGSACEAGSTEPSHVLAALGLNEQEAASSIRISMGAGTTADDIEATAKAIVSSVQSILSRLR